MHLILGFTRAIFVRFVVGIYDMYMDNPIWLMPTLLRVYYIPVY
nr:MAG TPA: hypothetical protein [Caudoviricetes sp.]